MPFRASGLELLRGGRRVLAVGSLDLPAGVAVSVTGSNGAGKTTLLETLAGLLPFRGSLALGDVPLPCDARWKAALRRAVAYVPAEPHLFRLTVLGNVCLPLVAAGASAADAEAAARETLDRAGLLPLADRPAHALSTGEAKRAALARALAPDPSTLLLDEPTAHVDEASGRVITRLLRDFSAAPGRSLLVATHAMPFALALATRHLAVSGGRLYEGPFLNHDGDRRADPGGVRILPPGDPAATARGTVVASRLVDGSALVTVESAGRRIAALLPDPAAAPPPGAATGIAFADEPLRAL